MNPYFKAFLFFIPSILISSTESISEISLIIQGEGELNILNNAFSYEPYEFLINGVSKPSCKKSCQFEGVLNNVTIKFENQIDSCSKMFEGITSIIEVDLSKFDASKVESMYNMFNGCSNMKKITFGNINTSSVKSMERLFNNCIKLETIDRLDFDTLSVTTMSEMFSYCHSLKSINAEFNPQNVENMHNLFAHCINAVSIKVPNFRSTKVKTIKGMFYNDSSLKYIDLPNFECSDLESVRSICRYCHSIVFINLPLIKIKSSTEIFGTFNSTNSYLKICINDETTRSILHEFSNNFDCSHKCFEENIKIDLKEKNCVTSCDESDYKYEYDKLCYENCPEKTYPIYQEFLCLNEKPEGYYLDSLKNYKKCYETCKSCDEGGNEVNNNCIECKTNNIYINGNNYDFLYELNKNGYKNCYIECPYYFFFDKDINKYYCTENKTCYGVYDKLIPERNECVNKCDNLYEVQDNDNPNEYRKCYKDTTGYYLDTNDSIYKKCYYSCETCEIQGNNKTHNCKECSYNYSLEFKINNSNYSNCFNCSYYYYFDEYENFHCTDNNTCPRIFPILDERECIKAIEITNMEENNLNECLNNEKTREKEIFCYDTILKDINDIFSSKFFDTTDIDNGQDQIIKIDKNKVILTTTENQKNNLNSDITTIDLGECEELLRKENNLSNSDKIYIKMLEVSQEEMRVPKVEYDIYTKLNGKNLTKLSLDSCQNTKISLSITINNVDNIDTLNISSGYYNDLCYTATTENGTDITLEDRKNEYPSKAACQDGCDFANYNKTLKKAKCICHPKESSESFKDMKIDKNKLLKNFKNIKNIINVGILKCYKVLFTKKGISKNFGFYIFDIIIIFHAIILILFYNKKLKLLIDKIKSLIFALKFLKLKKGDEKEIKDKKENEEKIIRFNEANDNSIKDDDNNYVNEIIK